MTHQDWTDQLRERMADYEAAAPEGLWDDIEQSLPSRQAKTIPLWLRLVGSAAMIIFVAGIGWWLWQERNPNQTLSQNERLRVGERSSGNRQKTLAKARNNARWPKGIENRRPKGKSKAMARISPYRESCAKRILCQEIPVSSTGMRTDTLSQNVATERNRFFSTLSQNEESERNPNQHILKTNRLKENFSDKTSIKKYEIVLEAEQTSPNHSGKKDISIGIMADNGLLAYTHINGVQMNSEMSKQYDYSDYLPTRASAPSDEIIWLTDYEEEQHHYRPVSLGLSVDYPITPLWSIQTGIVYTYLHSDFKNKMGQISINTEQKLHYIGIPLIVKYNILRRHQWKAYINIGTEIDFNIYAKSVVYCDRRDALSDSRHGQGTETEGIETQIKKDHAQWSMGGAIGIEYDIIPELGLYAEPGYRYYFNNGSNIQNYFKDQPHNWSIQFGLRLNLNK